MSDDLQPVLFESYEDGPLLFSDDENRKRYTAEQVEQVSWKRNAILMLVAAQWPVEVIARQLHVNLRTVTALSKRQAAQVAGFSKQYADVLMRFGAEAFAVARSRIDEASPLQAATVGGILTDKGIALAGMGEVGEERIVKEAADGIEAVRRLRELLIAGPAIDCQSVESSPIAEETARPAEVGAGGGADRDQATEGEGGGSGGREGSECSIDSEERGLLGKVVA